jgi:hypothetical protein
VTRATQISRVVFALLVLATFFAFFAAQRLKHSDPLVYSVSFKRYISPNDDGLREKGRVRFRTQQKDRVSVEVIDRTGTVVRALADGEPMAAGPHTFYWNGRFRGGEPVPDGAYRVRISLRANGRSFVPEQFFVVDTDPPLIVARVRGAHLRSILRGRRPIAVTFAGAGTGLRAEFFVYRVRGSRTDREPVAAFLSTRRSDQGIWDQKIGHFSRWSRQCSGVRRSGRARPAPTGSYVIVARACDAAGNVGASSSVEPPRRGTTRGASGVTLTGVQIAPPVAPAIAGSRTSLRVAPPRGGYSWRISRIGGGRVAGGRARGGRLSFKAPTVKDGLYELRVRARRPVAGDRGLAVTPLPISRGRARLLIVQPAIAWQATNPVDVSGDGFADSFATLPAGEQLRLPLQRFLARASGPSGFLAQEGALGSYIQSAHPELKTQTTTDAAISGDPAATLRGHNAVLFTGDERWLPARLGTELRRFVERGGRVAFFSLDAFRRTAALSGGQLVGPSDKRSRDIFGEAVGLTNQAEAPVVPFTDELGLLRGPTGLFTGFEQSEQLARGARVLTAAGREADRPALIGYRLGRGTVIRVGVRGWTAELARGELPNVAWTTDAIIEVLRR